ncbi:MAG: flagellar hook-associated family protein [Hyphomicrobiaceae bacterium]
MIANISTASLQLAAKSSIATTQARLAEVVAESSSGRHHDVGLVLGSGIARVIELRTTSDEIDTIARTNGLLASRLSTTQSALSEIAAMADDFVTELIAYREAGADRALLVADATSRLEQLTQLLATTSNGAYVFGGDNTTVSPLTGSLSDPLGPARAGTQTTFAGAFGFASNDPLAAGITPAQLSAYLDGPFAAQFTPPAWSAAISAAGAEPERNRISLNEVVTTPVSANSDGIRELVASLLAITDSGTEALSATTFDTLIDSAAKRAGSASDHLTSSQSILGLVQQRVAQADTRLTTQKGVLERQLGTLENVDLAEASLRLNILSTKLQTSYAATVRIQSLSILNYL